jgi:hypothetical protein
MHGAIAESSLRKTINENIYMTLRSLRLCGECISLWMNTG